MEIIEVDVTDEALLRAAYDVQRRALLEGRPGAPFWSWQEMAGAARRPDPGIRDYRAVAVVDGRVVGLVTADFSLHDNRDKSWMELAVDPEHQRRGHGRALLEHGIGVAEDDGRTVLVGEAILPFDSAADHRVRRFAAAAGFVQSNVEVVRHLTLPVREDQLDAWEARASLRSVGYHVETFVNEIPERLLPSLVVLLGQLLVDAPTGAVEWEDERITPDDLVESRASSVAAGRTVYETVALAPDGTVAAQTTLSVPPPGRLDVSQWGTFVHRAHRGHSLGLAVKVANLRAVTTAHPEMRRVRTQNAETNDWMVAINAELGFEPVEASVEFVRHAPRA